MNAFAYRDGILHVENLSLVAAAERVGTPFYCYGAGELERRYRALAHAIAPARASIAFAVKANSNLAVIGVFAALG